MLAEEGGFSAGGEGFLFFGFAGGLQGVEFGGFALAAAGETVFLKREIAQLFLVAAAHFKDELGLVFGLVPVVGIGVDDFGAAQGDDAEFQNGNGGETPADIRYRLDESAFFAADGLKLPFVIGDVAPVVFGVLRIGEHDGGAGEAMLDGIEAGFCFALGGDGAGGFLRILAVGGETGIGDGFVVEFGHLI